MKVINNTPIWVLGNTEINLVRVTTHEKYVSGRDFFDCSKWTIIENAKNFAKKFPELLLYRIEEYEDGKHRSIIKFIEENIN